MKKNYIKPLVIIEDIESQDLMVFSNVTINSGSGDGTTNATEELNMEQKPEEISPGADGFYGDSKRGSTDFEW